MISVTPSAVKKVLQIAERDGVPKILRFGVRGGGCAGLTFFWDFETEVRENDLVTPYGDLQVVVDPKSSTYLEGAQFDYESKNLLKAGFRFEHKGAKKACSCGESFSL